MTTYTKYNNNNNNDNSNNNKLVQYIKYMIWDSRDDGVSPWTVPVTLYMSIKIFFYDYRFRSFRLIFSIAADDRHTTIQRTASFQGQYTLKRRR